MCCIPTRFKPTRCIPTCCMPIFWIVAQHSVLLLRLEERESQLLAIYLASETKNVFFLICFINEIGKKRRMKNVHKKRPLSLGFLSLSLWVIRSSWIIIRLKSNICATDSVANTLFPIYRMLGHRSLDSKLWRESNAIDWPNTLFYTVNLLQGAPSE